MINKIIFFPRNRDAEISALNNQVIDYPYKAEIVEEGQKDMAVFIVLKCKAIVTRNDFPKVIINTLVDGTLFGDVSF